MVFPLFTAAQVEGIVRSLQLLASADQLTSLFGVSHSGLSKTKRLRKHCLDAQRRDGTGDEVVRLIEALAHPARFPEPRVDVIDGLRIVLWQSELMLGSDMRVRAMPSHPGDSPADADEQLQLRALLVTVTGHIADAETAGHATAAQLASLRQELHSLDQDLGKVPRAAWAMRLSTALLDAGLVVTGKRSGQGVAFQCSWISAPAQPESLLKSRMA